MLVQFVSHFFVDLIHGGSERVRNETYGIDTRLEAERHPVVFQHHREDDMWVSACRFL